MHRPRPRGTPLPRGLLAAAGLLRAWPHLRAFWPELRRRRAAPGAGAAGRPPAVAGRPWRAAAGWAGGILHLSPGPFAPPRFGRRAVPAILFAAEAPDPVAAALAAPPRPLAEGRGAAGPAARGADRRPAGLPDPGPAALGCGPGEAVILLDPCVPGRAGAAWGLHAEAAAAAAALGRPLRLLRDRRRRRGGAGAGRHR